VSAREWDVQYQDGDLPWDTGKPEPHLVELVQGHRLAPRPALDVGCGTGTNSRWLAEQGFDVLGVDISPTAVRQARGRAQDTAGVRFASLDFLEDDVPGGPFGLVFDRGCFHVFDEAADRARFAERVSGVLAPGGLWLSIVGSTEGPPRDYGPPRRSARDLAAAIEPFLELVELRTSDAPPEGASPGWRAWVCMSRLREVPAQPSTRR
jgi:SAM-dependent methyltransferase